MGVEAPTFFIFTSAFHFNQTLSWNHLHALKLFPFWGQILSQVLNERRAIGSKFMATTKERAQGNALKGEAWKTFFLLAALPDR